MPLYQYDSPDRFVVGTVGPPGERTFFLQAVEGGRITSVVLEKAQVAALAERVGELLEEVRRRFGDAPDLHEVAESDNDPLQRPIEEEFRVGTLALAWDAQTRRVIVEAQQLRGPDESGESPRVQAFAETCPTMFCASTSPPRKPGLLRSVRGAWSQRAAPTAPCAATPSTPAGTSARARMATVPCTSCSWLSPRNGVP